MGGRGIKEGRGGGCVTIGKGGGGNNRHSSLVDQNVKHSMA